MNEYIARKWRDYHERVLPHDASPIQVIETRRAFYAGAQGLLVIMMTQLEDGHEPTDADLRMMDDVDAELQQFARDVVAGRK